MGALYKGVIASGVLAAIAFYPVTTMMMSGNEAVSANNLYFAALVSDLANDEVMTIIAVGPVPEVLTPATGDRAALREAISRAQAIEKAGEGIDPALVNGALMTASGIYATYITAGNEGALEASGGKVFGAGGAAELLGGHAASRRVFSQLRANRQSRSTVRSDTSSVAGAVAEVTASMLVSRRT